jgi:hypothetical protein
MTLLTVLHANGAPRTAEQTTAAQTIAGQTTAAQTIAGQTTAAQVSAEQSANSPPSEKPAEAKSSSSAASIRDPARSAVIYVARRGWHIDIGFDAADLQPPLGLLAPDFPGVRYLFFGFGDEHYLLSKNRNAPVLLAALWPGRGMILATGLQSPPSEAFGAAHVISLSVTRAQLQAAEDFVDRSFGAVKSATDSSASHTGIDDGRPIRPYGRGPYEGSLYFISKDEYSALHTCNTWAAEVLKAGGLHVHSVGVVFAGQLWAQARRLQREERARARRASLLSRRSIVLAACDQQGGLVPS